MKFFVCGGAGFVGQHVVKRLESEGHQVRVYDKVMPAVGSGVHGNIHELALLTHAMHGSDVVWHLASNADIAASAREPSLDFTEGTKLTNNVLEAMRVARVRQLVYFSGSGVYGDYPGKEFHEDHGPLLPISTYGASKIASEAMIHAYCAMFDIEARVFRPANLVGYGQTHGVGFDFMRSLKADPSKLRVLGDGYQTKSYLHITDALDAVWTVIREWRKRHDVFNLASEDYMTVRDIARIAVEVSGAKDCRVEYTGSDRGWNGDVPRINFDCSKIRALGWKPKATSAEAIRLAMISML